MDTLVVLAVIPLGLVVGSLLTMVIDRVPDDLPLREAPRCPHCEATIAWRDRVPVVSWIALGGRCRSCDEHITAAYPAVEVVTAALFVAGALRFGASWVLVPILVLFAMLVAVSTVDLYLYRIPDRIVFPTLAVSFVLIVAVSVGLGSPDHIISALVGMVLYAGLLFVPFLIKPGGMGFGDVKLALVLGLFIGWLYSDLIDVTRLVLLSLLIGSMLGVAGGGAVALLRRGGRDVLPAPDAEAAADGRDDEADAPAAFGQAFPFGPALAASCVITGLFSAALLGA